MKEGIKLLYKDSLFLHESEITEHGKALLPYLQTLNGIVEKGGYDAPECSINLVSDKEHAQKTEALAEKLSSEHLEIVFVVGIGGSNLGTMAIYEALYGKSDVFLSRAPKLIFADTNNSREMEIMKKVVEESISDPREFVLNIVTKSGTTTETIANAGFLFDILSHKFGEKIAAERTVVTTDYESSLWKIALEKGMHALAVPENVGGRYAVFSAVGLFPLRLVRVNIQELLAGALLMRENCVKKNGLENPALFGAVATYLYSRKKLSMYNSFFFNSELESVGKWWRQLYAESLGKRYNKDGGSIHAGMTPIVSVGSIDLHSMVQLYFGGPKDKFTNFIYAENSKGMAIVPTEHVFKSLSPDISGKDFADIMDAILTGTKEAYKEHALPFIETVFPNIDAYSVGAFMQMKMIETMLLAKLWNIDAFDQPEVESYKKFTRELLRK